jgi:hypothetical protein
LFKTGAQRLDTLVVMDEPTLRPLFPAADELPEDLRPGARLLDSIVLGHKSKFINTRFLF